MSLVSGVVLIVSCAEDCHGDDKPPVLLDDIHQWLDEHYEHQSRRLEMADSSLSGGSKDPQLLLMWAGFNHFITHEDDFGAFVAALPWKYPEDVVLVINPEHGKAKVFRPKKGL